MDPEYKSPQKEHTQNGPCMKLPTLPHLSFIRGTTFYFKTQLQSTTQPISFELCTLLYKVVQIWPGLFTLVNSPGHIWTTLYLKLRIYFTCFMHIIWLPVGNFRSKISYCGS